MSDAPAAWDLSQVHRALVAAGCACQPVGWVGGAWAEGGIPLLPRIWSSSWATLGDAGVAVRHASHQCSGCGTQVTEA